jgi:hypothetical protein
VPSVLVLPVGLDGGADEVPVEPPEEPVQVPGENRDWQPVPQ